MVNNDDFDLFVIGGGSGGVRASRVAAGHCARVGISESYRNGGTCVIRGSVPKKLLVQASHHAEDFEDAKGFGWSVPPASFSWETMAAAKEQEISRLSRIYESRLDTSGVVVFRGAAQFVDAHTVSINGRMVRARNFLIATGGKPFRPSIPGIELAITSDKTFDFPTLPQRLLIVGGGFIAVEFAGIFNGLGVDVTLAYRSEQILRGFDHDVRQHLHEEMSRKGIRILLQSQVASLARRADGKIDASFGGASPTVEPFDAVMYATSRIPSVDGLNLAAAGVEVEPGGGIQIDMSCTSLGQV